MTTTVNTGIFMWLRRKEHSSSNPQAYSFKPRLVLSWLFKMLTSGYKCVNVKPSSALTPSGLFMSLPFVQDTSFLSCCLKALKEKNPRTLWYRFFSFPEASRIVFYFSSLLNP